MVALAGAIGLAGCGGDDNNTPTTRLRVINALSSLGKSSISTTVAGNTHSELTNITYGKEFGPAEVNVVNPVSIGINTGAATVTNNVNLTAGVDQPVLVTGVPGAGGIQQVAAVALSPQDLGSTPVSGQARVYFINAASDVATADFSYIPEGGSLTTNVNLQNVSYPGQTPQQLINFGNTTFRATVGADTVNSAVTTLSGGKTYVVVLVGRTVAAGVAPLATIEVTQLN
jgi:hypothetical protein